MQEILLEKMPPIPACCSGYASPQTEGHDVNPPCSTMVRIEEIISAVRSLFDGGFSATEAYDEFNIAESTRKISREIVRGRTQALIKHRFNSIEAKPSSDTAFWLACLGEEFGEICESLTYDKDSSKLRSELIDVLCVASAWVAALDRESEEEHEHETSRSGDGYV